MQFFSYTFVSLKALKFRDTFVATIYHNEIAKYYNTYRDIKYHQRPQLFLIVFNFTAGQTDVLSISRTSSCLPTNWCILVYLLKYKIQKK